MICGIFHGRGKENAGLENRPIRDQSTLTLRNRVPDVNEHFVISCKRPDVIWLCVTLFFASRFEQIFEIHIPGEWTDEEVRLKDLHG
jgi:hypothetical protein